MFAQVPSQNLHEEKTGCDPFGYWECSSTCRCPYIPIPYIFTLTRLYQNFTTNWKYISTRVHARRQVSLLLISRIIRIPTQNMSLLLGLPPSFSTFSLLASLLVLRSQVPTFTYASTFLAFCPFHQLYLQGTIIVILGVIGIVAFGSINSGLTSKTDVEHLTYLWRRGGWLGFFFAMAIALISVYIFTSRLDAVLTARGDIDAPPFSATSFDLPFTRNGSSIGNTRLSGDGQKPVVQRLMLFTRTGWQNFMLYLTRLLEVWTGPKDDKQIAWTLGIGWACCGGGLAGGCLVFAKATFVLFAEIPSYLDLTPLYPQGQTSVRISL